MTSTPTASYLSLVKVGESNTTVGLVTSAKFGRKGNLKDISSLGDEWVRRHRTIKDANLSIDCVQALDDPGQTAIEAVAPGGANDGDALLIRVYRGASHYWQGYMKLEAADETSQAGDNVDGVTYTLAVCDGVGMTYT